MNDRFAALAFFGKPIEFAKPTEDYVHKHKRKKKMAKKEIEKQHCKGDPDQGVGRYNLPTFSIG